jgi:hypothetical protein
MNKNKKTSNVNSKKEMVKNNTISNPLVRPNINMKDSIKAANKTTKNKNNTKKTFKEKLKETPDNFKSLGSKVRIGV